MRWSLSAWKLRLSCPAKSGGKIVTMDTTSEIEGQATCRNLKLVVANMFQNTEPNLRRFSVAKCSAAAVVKRSKISPSSPPTPPSLLPDDARRISCLDFYSSSSYLTLKGLTSPFIVKSRRSYFRRIMAPFVEPGP